MRPDSGQVSVLGKTPYDHRIETVQHIGVVFGQRTQLWWDLPAIDSFELLKTIYQIPDAKYHKTLSTLTDTLELADICYVPVRQLSLGQRMRCDIAASLLHAPKILFLDEPTIGLDAVAKLAVRDFVRHLNKTTGVTVMLTTHDMDDIESLCTRVLVLSEGHIFLDGSLSQLRRAISPERRLIIDLVNENEHIQDPHATLIKQERQRVWLQFDPNKTTTPELITRVLSQHAIRDLYVENRSIEEIIADFYRGTRR